MIHNIPKLQKMSALLLAVFLMVAWGSEVKGQTQYEWRSEAANGNWHAPTHWWIGSATTAGFGVMRFNNNAHLNMTNNNGGSTFNTHAIHFRSGNTSVRTIGGDAIRLFDFGGASGASPYILNTSSATHVLNINLNGGVENRLPLLILLDGTGGLTFNGTINNRDNNINIQGNTSTANTATFNGIISGSGGLFKTNSNITAVFNAANTFTGTTTVEAGVIRLGQDGASFGGATSAIRLGAGGSIDLNGFNTTVRYISERGTGDGGVVQLGSGTLTIVDNEATTRFQSSINGTGGSIVYDPTASSVMSLYNAQGYTGSTTVKAGTVTSSGAMQTSSIIIEGGTFRVTGSDNRLAANPSVTLSGGVFNPRTNETISSLTGTAGTVSLTDASTLTVENSATNKFDGVISGIGSLIKSGSGKLSLTNTNTFTGPTVVNEGSLEIANNFASSAITINDGGTFRVTGTETNSITVEDGGTLEIASGAVLTVRANETLTINSGGTVNMQGDLVVLGTLVLEDGATLVVPSGRNLVASNITYNGTGKIEFQRLLSEPPSGGHWVMLGSPVPGFFASVNDEAVSEGLLDLIWTQGFPGSNTPNHGDSNVLFFDETFTDNDGDRSNNYLGVTSNALTPGQGYLVRVFPDYPNQPEPEVDFSTPLSISGQQNAFNSGSSFSYNSLLTFTSGGGDGWNLISNPFGATLDWTVFTKSTNFNANIYLMDTDNTFYAGPDIDDLPLGVVGLTVPLIAPFQAFFVKLDDADDINLQFGTSAKTTGSQNQADFFNASTLPIVAFSLTTPEANSSTVLTFRENGKIGYDRLDAYYLTPFGSTFAYLLTVNEDGDALLNNNLPLDLEEPLFISLYAGAYHDAQFYDGTAQLTWPTLMDMPSGWSVKLIDNYTGTEIDIMSQTSYEFEFGSSAKLGSSLDRAKITQRGTPVMSTEKMDSRFTIVIDPNVATSSPINSELPAAITLSQNYPNPFNPTTQITYELPQSAEVRLDVFNLMGQRVATLVNASQNAGAHTVTFDAANLSSGVYVYRLQAGATVLTRKMTLVK